MKGIIYSIVLFLLGLGFISGDHYTIESTLFSSVSCIFLSLPLCIRVGSLVQRNAQKNKKQHRATA